MGVRQGECSSPLFAMYIKKNPVRLVVSNPFSRYMYINDLEDEIIHKGVGRVDIGMLKLFILLYAEN